MEFEFPDQVDNLESKIPEQFRGYYVPNADKTLFTVDPAHKTLIEMYTGTNKSFKETTKLKTQNGNEAAVRRQALTKIADVGTTILGIDMNGKNVDADLADLISTAVTDLATKAAGGEQIKVNMATVQAAAEKRIGEIQKVSDEKLGKMQSSLERYLIDKEATAALAGAKGSVDLLLPHVKSSVKVVQNGEDYTVVVVDAAGEARPNGKGGFMGINDLVAEMKATDKFARAFESEARGGSGSSQQQQRQSPKLGAGEMTSQQKIEAGLKARGTKL